MTDSARAMLREGLEALSIDDSGEIAGRLERYIDELELWNRKLRLVDATGDELVGRHILDCLAAVPLARTVLPEGGSIADLGSGAGLPGIPFAVALPDSAVALIERSGRRAGFLRNCRAVLGLSNVTVCERSYTAASDVRYDLVVARALTAIDDTFVDHLVRMLTDDGHGLLLKGRRERIETELASVATTDALFDIRPLVVPRLDAERHAVLVSRQTPD